MENIEILNKAGLKITKTRNIVLSIFKNTDRVLNVSEIYNICKEKGVNINLSTVYRICEIFSEKKILDKVINSDRINGYKISVLSHVHNLTCSNCKTTVEVKCPFNILSQYIEMNTGFTLTKHNIDIQGICNKCKNEKES